MAAPFGTLRAKGHESRQFDPPYGRDKPVAFPFSIILYLSPSGNLASRSPAHPLLVNKKRVGASTDTHRRAFCFFSPPGSRKTIPEKTSPHQTPYVNPPFCEGVVSGLYLSFVKLAPLMRFSGFRPDSLNVPSLRLTGCSVRGFNRPYKGFGRRKLFNLCLICA